MPDIPPPRRRGAQSGNRNAKKHGFYARRLPPAERKDIQEASRAALDQEIIVLRVYIRRVPLALDVLVEGRHELYLGRSCRESLLFARDQPGGYDHQPAVPPMFWSRVVRTQVQLIQPRENDGVFNQALNEALMEMDPQGGETLPGSGQAFSPGDLSLLSAWGGPAASAPCRGLTLRRPVEGRCFIAPTGADAVKGR